MVHQLDSKRVLQIGSALIAILALVGEVVGRQTWMLVVLAAVIVLVVVIALMIRRRSTV